MANNKAKKTVTSARKEKNIASAMAALVGETVENLGYSLWDVEYVKEGASYYLRFTIDSEHGVDISDCEKVHRTIDPLIDEADPIEDFYYLEVSSPGLERTLRTPAHFSWAEGKVVRLKLFAALNGQKELCGTLLSYEESTDTLTVTPMGSAEKTGLPRSAVSKATLFYDFDAEDDLSSDSLYEEDGAQTEEQE